MAHSLVNQLPNSEQASDVAFSPEGRTLAAVGRTGGTLVWTVIDSAMRTQLSGFDARPSSLAFSSDGVLAGGGWDGTVWFWRNGRCPEIGAPWPQPVSTKNEIDPRAGRILPPGRDGANRPRGPAERGAPPWGGEPSQVRDRPVSLAFDSKGRLIAQNTQGLRVWPAGPISAQAPPIMQLPLPPAAGTFNLTPIARTPDGKTMVLVRSSAIFLWHAEKPQELISVIPHSGAEPLAGADHRFAARRYRRRRGPTSSLSRRSDRPAWRSDLPHRPKPSLARLGDRGTSGRG